MEKFEEDPSLRTDLLTTDDENWNDEETISSMEKRRIPPRFEEILIGTRDASSRIVKGIIIRVRTNSEPSEENSMEVEESLIPLFDQDSIEIRTGSTLQSPLVQSFTRLILIKNFKSQI